MARLGDICTIVSGTTPKSNVPEYWDGTLNWVTPAELSDNSNIIFETERKITASAVTSCSLKAMPIGTVLLSSRAPIGKVAITGTEMYCNQGFKNLICSEKIYNRYLYWFLKGKTAFLNSLGRGATFKEISKSIVENIEIPLCDIDQQRQIAATFDHVDHLISLRKQQLEKLDQLIKSRFVEMFGDYQFPKARLGDVCSKITDGTHKTPNYIDQGITFISAKNIVNGELNFADVKYISEQEYLDIQKRCQTEVNDILLSKSGSLGAVAIVRTAQKLGLFESLAIIKYDRAQFVPEFLCEQLRNDSVQRQFVSGTKGIAVKHLHLGVIADTIISIPPMELQQAFADFVTATDKSKYHYYRSTTLIKVLAWQSVCVCKKSS